jgi:hypothetical protein
MHPLTTMCSTARSVALLAAGLLVGIPFPVQQVQAQTRKVAEQKDEAGHTKHVPFVSFDTFSEATIYRATGRKTPEEESDPGVTLGALLTIASIDTVTALLGEPDGLKQTNYPDGGGARADLHYEGLRVRYVKLGEDPDAGYHLRGLKITSSDWTLMVGETALVPGSSADRLSPEVRRSTYFDIAAPSAKARVTESADGLETLRGDAQVSIKVVNGTIQHVRFNRVM